MFALTMMGLIIFTLVLIFDRKILKVDLKVIQTFITLMVLMTFFRLTLFSLGHDLGQDLASINQGLAGLSFWRFATVFWEDAFFAIPIYYMIDRWNWSKYITYPFMAITAIIFGLGHMYQFEMAYFATLVIPYMVFYRAGKKYGFGTSMICHILFDMITFLTLKMAWIVL